MIKYRKTWGPPFTEAECMKYFAQLVLAFRQVHEKKMVHMDVKLENVLMKTIGKQKVAKLSHFNNS